MATIQKLKDLNEKIQLLTTGTEDFKTSVEKSLEKLKPLIISIHEKVRTCRMTDDEASSQLKDLRSLMTEKDKMCSNDHIKKTDHENQLADLETQIQNAITKLDSLLDKNTNGTSDIDKLIGSIEKQLVDVEDMVKLKQERADAKKPKSENDDDEGDDKGDDDDNDDGSIGLASIGNANEAALTDKAKKQNEINKEVMSGGGKRKTKRRRTRKKSKQSRKKRSRGRK
jgi:hypothetical protein